MSADDAMKNIIQRLAHLAHQTFLPLSRGGKPAHLDELLNVVRLITAEDLNFDTELVSNTEKYIPSSLEAPVTYIHIYEDQCYSLGVFILRSGYSLPLHDHPGMYGICKVIHGKISKTSYSHTPRRDIDVPHSLHRDRRSILPTVANRTISINAGDCCCLSPVDGNFHEITAVDGPAAFLDILAPPYDDSRNCHYYKDVLTQDGVTWLRRVSQPMDYWCHQAPYLGPPIT